MKKEKLYPILWVIIFIGLALFIIFMEIDRNFAGAMLCIISGPPLLIMMVREFLEMNLKIMNKEEDDVA